MLELLYDMLGFSKPTLPAPVIGISGGDADSASVRAMMTQIQATGGIPIFLGNHSKRDPAKDIEKIDALIVMGNNADIDPERYGAAKHEKTNPESATPEGKARADYEYALMKHAIESKMPILGICGGMQRLNVMLGGTLDQRIADKLGNDDHAQQEHNIAPFIPVQVVGIAPGSTLADISREVAAVYTPAHAKTPLSAIAENSMHHQAVDKLGAGLRVAGMTQEKDKDGKPIQIVEAIEADPKGRFGGQFMLGVQWHPEFSASPLGTYIAQRVTHEAQAYAKAHNRTHSVSEAIDENVLSALATVRSSETAKPAIGGMTERLLMQQRTLEGRTAI